MPFIIQGQWYNRVVTVGHHYNDTATTQVQVTALRPPTPTQIAKHPDLEGKGKIKLLEKNGKEKWYYPHVIDAEWVPD